MGEGEDQQRPGRLLTGQARVLWPRGQQEATHQTHPGSPEKSQGSCYQQGQGVGEGASLAVEAPSVC